MKKNLYFLLGIAILFAVSCKDVIFYPIKGTISGIVTDNNGTPLAGITVSVTYVEPSQSPGQTPFPTTKTAQTDHTGYYRLSDIWDEANLSIQESGFMPVSRLIDLRENNNVSLDLSLDGSPTVVSLSLSKQVLAVSAPDTIIADMEVLDAYNASVQEYQCNVLLLDANQSTVAIIPAGLRSQGLKHYLFEGLIQSGELPGAGTYPVIAEVQDPDGHVHFYQTGLSITAQ